MTGPTTVSTGTGPPGLYFPRGHFSSRYFAPNIHQVAQHAIQKSSTLTEAMYEGPTTINFSHSCTVYGAVSITGNLGPCSITFNPLTGSGTATYGGNTYALTCSTTWVLSIPSQSLTGTFDPSTGTVIWSNKGHWYV